MKRLVSMLVLLALVLGLAACGAPGAEQPEAVTGEVVTDAETLAWLWEDYLYPAITSLGNGREFDAAAGELPARHDALQYAVKYLLMNDPEGVFGDDDPAELPDAMVADWALRLTGVDIGPIDHDVDYEYNSYHFAGTNLVNMADARSVLAPTAYTEMTPWSIRLGEVTYDAGAGLYTARLTRYYDNRPDSRVVRHFDYTLRERAEDDVLQIVAYRQTLPDYSPRLAIDFHGQQQDIGSLGEELWGEQAYYHGIYIYSLDHVIFPRIDWYEDGQPGQWRTEFWGIDMNTNEILGVIKWDGEVQNIRRAADGGFLFLDSDRVQPVNDALEPVGAARPLPMAKAAWGYYHCTADGLSFTYINEDGDLMLLRDGYVNEGGKLTLRRDGQESVLCSRAKLNDRNGFDYPVSFGFPEFVDDDTAVVVKLLGYESLNGYARVDLATGAVSIYEGFDFDRSVRSNNTVYRLFIPEGEYETQPLELALKRLDLVTGEQREDAVLTADASQVTYEVTFLSPLANDRYLCYLVSEPALNDSIENRYHIVRVDLATMEAATVVTLTGWSPRLMYMDAQGAVLFDYYFEGRHGLAKVK